jgi:hypothetical protein
LRNNGKAGECEFAKKPGSTSLKKRERRRMQETEAVKCKQGKECKRIENARRECAKKERGIASRVM